MTQGLDFYPNEPYEGGWSQLDVFDEFLRWVWNNHKASDIKFSSVHPVYIRVHGQWYPVTRRTPSKVEMEALVDAASKVPTSSARALSGYRVDFSYEMLKVNGDRRSGMWRFRANATACLLGNTIGLSLTLRTIPDVIPDLDDLGITEDLAEHLFPDHGLISIAGVMGSGKTTTLAAIIQRIRKNQRRSILTIEKPIEFDYTRIPNALGPIEQMEVPGMIQSFSEGIISATRKASDVLLVGETNDRETMEAMIHAAEVGIAVYHTIHTQSVSAIPGRIIHQFPQDESAGIAVSFLSAARVLIQQRLVPRVGGGRVALREYLVLDDAMRQRLIELPIEKIQPVLEEMVRSSGRPLLDDARAAFEAGLIDRTVLTKIEREKL